MLVQNPRSCSTFVAHSMLAMLEDDVTGGGDLLGRDGVADVEVLRLRGRDGRGPRMKAGRGARSRARAACLCEAKTGIGGCRSGFCSLRSELEELHGLPVEVNVGSISCTLSDDSTSTMGTAMSTVAARDDEATADDEAAADDEATVIAESVGVRDEAIVSGEVLMLSLSRLRLITYVREKCSSSGSCRRGCSASSCFRRTA